MSKLIEQCSECGEELDVIDVAPCDDCGWDNIENEHFLIDNIHMDPSRFMARYSRFAISVRPTSLRTIRNIGACLRGVWSV